jgi:hypothetical protein
MIVTGKENKEMLGSAWCPAFTDQFNRFAGRPCLVVENV